MDFLVAVAIPLYMLMLPYTLAGFGVIGSAISLYKHSLNPLAYSFLAALFVNVGVVLLYLNFAHFG
ncbi:MAG: hypothetical protein A3J46_06160 [Candidatus Yanofskybacteria bacterium RIFCSPHIGHO2_02_FULL_41_11]|uniref:Uncharacterized protein n=1 Tax=Candidatus Yanofskybacteria bacterium RIFCSPHIGHO2_02_FULL_41_11 TaxID=1802675 RepID=A0A1F8F7D6_9BACT|nr:MAG: hypothetical protein A3J46_06160 [Candidatus Yanofskybacteria bacterium RIFCSPHIGHO2_02_FULL_41_11]